MLIRSDRGVSTSILRLPEAARRSYIGSRSSRALSLITLRVQCSAAMLELGERREVGDALAHRRLGARARR